MSMLSRSIATAGNVLSRNAAARHATLGLITRPLAAKGVRVITYSLKGVSPKIRLDDQGQAWVAPSADVVGNVEVKQDASVWFKAVVRGDNDLISIGERSNIQDAAVLHTDPGIPLLVGEDVTVGHHAVLHGCKIGNGSLIGIGAIVMNNAEIGEGCLIGAGSLITEGKKIPPYSLVKGSPGKVVRELSEEERKDIIALAAKYVAKARLYASGLVPVKKH